MILDIRKLLFSPLPMVVLVLLLYSVHLKMIIVYFLTVNYLKLSLNIYILKFTI